MTEHAILFETRLPPQDTDPARMDVACFVGLIAERAGAAEPGTGGAGPDALLDRPVTVTSLAEFEALFDPDARIESRAVIEGGRLPAALPGSGIDPHLDIVIDGAIRRVALAPLPGTPQELVAQIAAAGLGLEVGLTPFGGLRLARPDAAGPGTLAVLPHAAYGFPAMRRARARAIPSAMGQAVRQFLAMGGRKAVVVRMGDPVPLTASRGERWRALVRVMTRPEPTEPDLADVLDALAMPVQPPATEAARRTGIAHLYGLDDTTFLLLPDLVDLASPPPGEAALQSAPPAPQVDFIECVPAASDLADAAQSALAPPVTDDLGNRVWAAALDRALRLVRDGARDKIVLAALPRFGRDVIAPEVPRSAFLQVAETWARTDGSAAAPGRLMAPDAVLAGHLAASALQRGTFLSAAIAPVAAVRDIDAAAAPSDLPTCRLRRVPRGIALTGDRTTARDPQWADGPVSRLMALLLRQAREVGVPLVFEPAGPALWGQVRDGIENLLEAAWRRGALAGSGRGDSYSVACDATTMSRDDIDAGRLICEVSFRPTVPVARIRVRLPMGGAPGTVTGAGGPQ